MMRRIRAILFSIVAFASLPLVANAHFLWLVRTTDGNAGAQLHLYFGELAEADDPDLLDRVADVEVWQITAQGEAKPLKMEKRSNSLTAKIADASRHAMFVLTRDLGVMSRGGSTFLLRYYAKTGPSLGDAGWTEIDCSKQLALDLIPQRQGDKVRVTVKWRGKPLEGAQVKAYGPGMEDFEAISDDRGQAVFAIGENGTYSIRARHEEAHGGTSDGESFSVTRHYSTLALKVGSGNAQRPSQKQVATVGDYPPLPEMVTSFGAAIVDDSLYVYGGHTGRAHSYYQEAQANTLRRLDLKNATAWESLGDGPGIQGLAMVAHAGKLVRIGGFTAKNRDGEDHDLWSQANVSCYDPSESKWKELSPLPEPRSSFDAAVLGDSIYVVGGWTMAGEADSVWLKTAYSLDLSANTPEWRALPEPPFQRRALSVAAYNGKIYAIGGMQQQGGPTTRVDIFDPATSKWSVGPSLQGDGMDGFGSSAFATGGRLYVTTLSGKLQQLTQDGSSWEVTKELDRARFFHRMLPLSINKLITVGGASMSVGKFDQVDVIDVK